MNGMGTRRDYGLGPRVSSPFDDVQPSTRAMVDGYREEIMHGIETQLLFNPLNTIRPQSSPLVDLQDPIQVHLLTETALADSREWVILSQEEVDDLKKQCQSLSQRIDQTRANLAIQSKYRDAAISMTRLYSPGGKRRSLLGHRLSGGSSGGEAEREAEAERVACERRCEELASELFSLERRIMEPQRRLLQHTAGILQLTHRGGSKTTGGTPANGQMGNNIPGSPESMYMVNGRESLELPSSGDGMFDERGLYLPIDLDYGSMNSIAIPQKSPNRKDTARLQTECDQLRANNDTLQQEVQERQQLLAEAERQLEDANVRLREVVVRFDPEGNETYREPPQGGSGGGGDDAGEKPGKNLLSQLRYMDDTLAAAEGEQERLLLDRATQGGGGSDVAFADLEGRLAEANSRLQGVLLIAGGGDLLLPLPSVTGASDAVGVEQQLDWLLGALPALEGHGGDQAEAAQKMDKVLRELWDTMQKGLAEAARRREERKASRKQMGLVDDEDEMSGDDWGAEERYTLDAFADKMRWLYRQVTKLREHKSVLKRQVKQQRELNNKSDAEKDQELRDRAAEVEQARNLAEEAQGQLARALADLSDVQQELMQKERAVQTATTGAEDTQAQLAERNSAIAALEARLAELQGSLRAAESQVQEVAARAERAEQAEEQARQAAEQAGEQAQAKDHELEQLNLLVVELKTEATIAKAELDGAYGSRAQRAADVAKLAKSSENDELQVQVDKLRGELTSTLRDYEDLTKDSVAAERVRHDLEGQLDDAVAARAALEAETDTVRAKLEAEIMGLREQLDAEKLRLPPTSPGGGTRVGAAMLSEQFRATMKEERKKFQEELRNEQSQRRKAEEELRTLRRTAGAGKSPLSPR